MVIETHKDIVYISGSLRSNQWPVIRTMACLVYEEHPEGIILDFSRVGCISEVGEMTFIAAVEEIMLRSLPFHLKQVPARVRSFVPACMRDLHEEDRCSVSPSSELALETWWNQIWGKA